jgi:hypothetical protein
VTHLPHAALEWSRGGLARFVSVRADAVVLFSSVPSPPGSRIDGTLLEEPRDTIRIKVHVCRRVEDGTFRLEGRALDLRRDLRARLEAMSEDAVLSSAPSGGGSGRVPGT